MQYEYKKVGNRYVTPVCSAPGNGGIHDVSQFVDAVSMLEEALATWDSPKLFHITLANATATDYSQFITRMKVKLKGVYMKYKLATETDAFKGHHQHWMVVVDTTNPEALFGTDNDSSAISKVTKVIRREAPDFRVLVAQPYKHPSTPYIPLTSATLDDAVDWFSYALKSRSKPDGPCYSSSRAARRTYH